MSEMQAFVAIGKIKNLSESTRNTIAIGIWLFVFVCLLFVTAHGQSKLMTAGLLLHLTGAYSTFLLCGKSKHNPLVNGVPYACILTGAVLLCLAPDFPTPLTASLVFLALTALMHWFVISDTRKVFLATEKTSLASECAT
jgi:hypothetical protein